MKKTMKKLLAMGLSLTMVLSLAACGSKEEPKQEQPAAEEPAQKEEAPAESEAEAEAPAEEADSAASDLSA